MKVTEEHQVSLQLATSKTDVYCKLAVMDNGQEVASAVGKGHVVLPAIIFSKDVDGDSNGGNRTPSRSCECYLGRSLGVGGWGIKLVSMINLSILLSLSVNKSIMHLGHDS